MVLKQPWYNIYKKRTFLTGGVRKTVSRQDMAEFPNKCGELRRRAVDQKQTYPVSFAINNSWVDTPQVWQSTVDTISLPPSSSFFPFFSCAYLSFCDLHTWLRSLIGPVFTPCVPRLFVPRESFLPVLVGVGLVSVLSSRTCSNTSSWGLWHG